MNANPIISSKWQSLVRPHILELQPYSSARDEYSGTEGVFLDANENPLGSAAAGAYNRYPDPYQQEVKQLLAVLKGVRTEQIFLGNGSDEPIDLLFRIFCRPGVDNVILMPPTYGMYSVSAKINDTAIETVPLTSDFTPNVEAVLEAANEQTKLLFLCSPNNPTGNEMPEKEMQQLLEGFSGIVVVDEAYIDFSQSQGFLSYLNRFPNLVVLQTFSKAWGMAALRLGMAFAHPELIWLMNKVKPPYNISQPTQELALKALQNVKVKDRMVEEILQLRDQLAKGLETLSLVEKIYPSQANFLLAKVKNVDRVYHDLLEKLVIVRNRSRVTLCEGCLRITVGTSEENTTLLNVLREL